MTLEELLYRRMADDPELAGRLARYGGGPAVFQQRAPDDTDRGWGGRCQYPRADYVAELMADPQRQTAGVVTVDLWCAENGPAPEELEPLLRGTLQGVFLHPEGQSPVSLAWARTDAFESRSQADPDTLVTGVTVCFDLYAFPRQETSDPDPVPALWQWARERAPSAAVIGRDCLGDGFRPTLERPAFYFRVERLETAEETNTVAWLHGVVAGHIFAPATEDRTRWLRALTDELAMDGEVTMLDGSPMFLRRIQVDSAASELAAGQLRLHVRFGLLRRPGYAHPLNHANMNFTGG